MSWHPSLVQVALCTKDLRSLAERCRQRLGPDHRDDPERPLCADTDPSGHASCILAA